MDDYAARITLHLNPEAAYASQRAGAIRAGGEILQPRIALCDSGQHGIAVRNRFVPRQAQRPRDIAGRTFDSSGIWINVWKMDLMVARQVRQRQLFRF